MKIAILSREPNCYSTRRLLEAARRRGHEVLLLDTLRLHLNLEPSGPGLCYQQQPLPGLDAVIPRIGASITAYGVAMLRQLELMGITCLNTSAGIACSRDKLQALQRLAQAGLGLPRTGFAHRVEAVPALIRQVGGAPLVVKVLEGTQGLGVALCDTHTSAESVLEAFLQQKVPVLAQEFIAEAEGRDLRCLVIGGQVVTAFQRQAQAGEFRSNLHRGGRASAVQLNDEEQRTAIAAVQALGLAVAGVDLLRSNRGPLVLEVNSSPGLEGAERVSGLDLADAMLAHLETRHAARG